jgi:hypothetical protein
MPRYIDGSGEDQKYFDQVQRATANQVNKDAGLLSPRDAANVLFNSGVTGAATPQQVSTENYRSFELIEYSPEPIPLISTQFIFNRTNTADMVANPTNYRAVAKSLFKDGTTLAGVITGGASAYPPPTLPVLPYTNSVGIDATNSLYDGTSRLTANAPILLYDSQVGVEASSSYPYGIGFRITLQLNFVLPKLWNVSIVYYSSAGVLVTTPIFVNSTFAFTSGALVNGVLVLQRVSSSVPNGNVDVFLNMKAATAVPPAGFLAPPAGITTFDGTNLAVCPQLIWDCA